MIKLNKPNKEEIIACVTAIITFLAALGLISSCTNTLIRIRGQGNQVKQQQETKVSVDSISTKINIKK